MKSLKKDLGKFAGRGNCRDISMAENGGECAQARFCASNKETTAPSERDGSRGLRGDRAPR